MATIDYIAYTWTGKRVRGRLDAESMDAAYEALRRDALVPYKLAPVKEQRFSIVASAPGLFKPNTQHLTDFSTQLSSLLASGVPLRRALDTLKNESPSLGLRYAIGTVIKDIEGGKRFSEAMERHTSVFSPSYLRLVRVGEATGGLPVSLQRLAVDLRQRKSVQDKVRSAMTYPVISLVMALIAGSILITYSLPSLISLLDEFGSDLPLATQLLKDFTSFMNEWFSTIAMSLGGAVAAFLLFARTKRGAYLRDKLLLKVPVLGGVILRSNMFALTSNMKALIEAGVPLIEALKLSGESISNAVLREALGKVIDEASSGSSLGQAFRSQTIFPPLLTQGVVTGEMSGSLGETLGGLAQYYRTEAERSIDSATQLIQPILIMVVAAIVGFVAIAVVSGIYSTLTSIRTT